MAVIDKTNLTPKLTPTEKPVIKYTDKNGESYMAREVQLENGYKCMAVSNTKNPAQATLMNHDVFEKTLKIQSLKNLFNVTRVIRLKCLKNNL